MTSMIGHESKSYETMLGIAGLLFIFAIVKIRGPNKSLNIKGKQIIFFFFFFNV